MNSYNYNDILSIGEIDINEKRYFSFLNEEEEILITRELINYCFWVQNNIEWLEKHLKDRKINLKDNNGFIKYEVLTEFWLKDIGKSEEIEKMLVLGQTISDVYDYIESYYNKFKNVFIKSNRDFGMILKEYYRSDEQAKRILSFFNNNLILANKTISNILNNNEKDIDHISIKDVQIIEYKLFKNKNS